MAGAVSIAAVTAAYGDFVRFVPAWEEAMYALGCDEVLVLTDAAYDPDTWSHSAWKNPCAYYFQQIASEARSDWIWPLGVDDMPVSDALDGLGDVDADVWQMGYQQSSDGVVCIPPQRTAGEFLASRFNYFVGGSPYRREMFERCGGYPDIVFEDWGLWRRMARHGARFESSGRVNFHYIRHDKTRSHTSNLSGAETEALSI